MAVEEVEEEVVKQVVHSLVLCAVVAHSSPVQVRSGHLLAPQEIQVQILARLVLVSQVYFPDDLRQVPVLELVQRAQLDQ